MGVFNLPPSQPYSHDLPELTLTLDFQELNGKKFLFLNYLIEEIRNQTKHQIELIYA